jgi:glycosyltransferase involved in cell wall biosynthesis
MVHHSAAMAKKAAPLPARARPRLLYVVSEDWYFLSHRLPMARAARQAGFEVHVATRVTDGGRAIEQEGFVLHAIPFARGGLNPSGMLGTIRALRKLHRKLRPAIVHHVALQASVLGSFAALGSSAARVNALTGLGYSFTSNSLKARSVRRALALLLRFLFNRKGTVVLVQNPDDRAMLKRAGVSDKRMVLIPGSGVDINRLQPEPEPRGVPTIAFVGRLLEDKGIRTLIQAHLLLRLNGSNVELLVAGTPDPANPGSIQEAEVASWATEPGVRWLGHVDDIPALWARAHVAVLPSRREGLPKSLLEAAACGRPMVATDVPGCREIVRPGENGLLVPVDNPTALAQAIHTLISSLELRARYGAAARRLVVEKFAADVIGRMTVDLYRRLFRARERARAAR